LYALYKIEKGFGLAFSDLKDVGIDRSTGYLEKVAGLKGLKASKEWNVLKTIQRIRNVIAHGDAKLKTADGKVKEQTINDMEKLGFLKNEDDEIVVEHGFLSKVLDVYDSYFKVIARAIDAKEETGPAKTT
jgi:hypothetical protein